MNLETSPVGMFHFQRGEFFLGRGTIQGASKDEGFQKAQQLRSFLELLTPTNPKPWKSQPNKMAGQDDPCKG